MTHHSPDATRDAEWHDELARVLSSHCFAGATRIRDMLAFLVQEAIAGRGARLKEYVIGVEVLDRGADFDPRVDTNVRTEAWRLRSRLERYYSGEGADNPLRIALPRRSFVPLLQPRTLAASVEPANAVAMNAEVVEVSDPISYRAGMPAANACICIAIERFQGAASAADAGLAGRLTGELMLELGDHPGLRIFTDHAGGNGSVASEADLLMRGEVHELNGEVRTLVQLIRGQSGMLVWSHGLHGAVGEGVGLSRRMALDIARALMTSPLARTMQFNRLVPSSGFEDGFVRRLLSSGFEGTVFDIEGARREVRRVDCWLSLHPYDQAAHRRLSMLLSLCSCVAPESSLAYAPLLRRCSRELLSQVSPSVDALVELGLAAMNDFDWYGALELLGAAVKADPDSSDARVVRGLCCLHLGDSAAAGGDLEIACHVDASSALAFATLGLSHYHRHRFAEASATARHALTLDPRCEPAAVLLADSELCGGETNEGIGLLQRVRSWSSRRPVILGRLGHTYAVTGREHLARSLLSELQHGGADGPPAHAAIADIYLGLGDPDAAFVQLGHAVRQRTLPDLLLLRSAPRYDGLRHDIRFGELIDGMALPRAA
jgi:tetratricopeptide (TPR) repeat protein